MVNEEVIAAAYPYHLGYLSLPHLKVVLRDVITLVHPVRFLEHHCFHLFSLSPHRWKQDVGRIIRKQRNAFSARIKRCTELSPFAEMVPLVAISTKPTRTKKMSLVGPTCLREYWIRMTHAWKGSGIFKGGWVPPEDFHEKRQLCQENLIYIYIYDM